MHWRVLLAAVPLVAMLCGACAAAKDAPIDSCKQPEQAQVGAVQRYVAGLNAGNLTVAFNELAPAYQRTHQPGDLALPGLRALQVVRLCQGGVSQGPGRSRQHLDATLYASFTGDPPAGWHQGSNRRLFTLEGDDSGRSWLNNPTDPMAGG